MRGGRRRSVLCGSGRGGGERGGGAFGVVVRRVEEGCRVLLYIQLVSLF